MAWNPGNALSAIPEVHTRNCIKSLGLAFDKLEKAVSTLTRNNEPVVNYALSDVTVTAGSGLTGGGDLSADITLNVGAGTGITVAADSVSISSSYLGANPTGTVGLSTVNGSATTYLRSDGAPALSQAIIPTWTQVHTFSAQDVHNAGVSLGTSGALVSAVVDGAAAVGFDLADSVTRTTGYVRKVRQGSTITEIASWDGRLSFGYSSSLAPLANHRLAFLDDDAATPAGAPITVGILGSVSHQDTAETVTRTVGVIGSCLVLTATGLSTVVVNGVTGAAASGTDTALAGKVLACFSGSLGKSTGLSVYSPTTKDMSFGKSLSPTGGYDHVTVLWAPNFSFSSTTGYPTARPGIVSAARVTIQDWGGSTTVGTPATEYWAVYGEHINGSSASYPSVTGFLRCTYPRRTGGTGVRAMHQWWEPWPNTSTIRGGAAEGDLYFDDNTNYTGGLWEYSGCAGGANAWNYLLSSPGVDALGGGAAPTLGTIGGTGPATAAQATWIKVNCADNVVRWVPAWV